jgi:hypothetical protein
LKTEKIPKKKPKSINILCIIAKRNTKKKQKGTY